MAMLAAASCSPDVSPTPPPASTNTPPVVLSIVAQGNLPREPAQYATLGEVINVSANVADAETPIDQLTFAWSARFGTFSGTGPDVTWQAPRSMATPTTVMLTVTVTERFSADDGTHENRVTASSAVRVHDSVTEVSDLAVQFLLDFSRQLDPTLVMRNFTDTCPTAADETGDVINNQQLFVITSYSVGTATTTVDFTGRCPFRRVIGDACAFVPVQWRSRVKATGQNVLTAGTDQVTAIFEDDRWRLCASDYDQMLSVGPLGRGLRFKR